MKLILIILAAFALGGCASSSSNLSPVGQVALQTSVRIAVRHALDSPRALEKARNIRAMAELLNTTLAEGLTVATLTTELSEEIDTLGLDPLSTADAKDLLLILSALLEQRVGSGELTPDGVVKVSEFVDAVLSALPVV